MTVSPGRYRDSARHMVGSSAWCMSGHRQSRRISWFHDCRVSRRSIVDNHWNAFWSSGREPAILV